MHDDIWYLKPLPVIWLSYYFDISFRIWFIVTGYVWYSLPLCGPTALWTLAAFSVSESYTQLVVLPGQGISPSQGCYLHTGQHKQNKHTQTSMPQLGFELTTPVIERAKMVHALGRMATVIGICLVHSKKLTTDIWHTAAILTWCKTGNY
jgi:hypothetical protein